MDDNMGDNLITNIDLNREPFFDPSSVSLGIEDRIRQLEAVSARARQSQPWRRIMSNPELRICSEIEPIVGVRDGNIGDNRLNCKRDISQLSKALEMVSDAKKIDGGEDGGNNCNNGSFFDCNICLDMAKDPILTCCGHLFCWSCFYQVPYVDSISKECPVCKGEVTDSNFTPIYGIGKNSTSLELESGMKVPPRPPARRVESVRQLSFGREVSHLPMVDAINRIRISLGLFNENTPPQGVTVRPTSVVNPPALQVETSNEGRQLSRVISQSPASFPSVSTAAIHSAERFVENLERYINNESVTSVGNAIVGIQSEPETGETNPAVPRRNDATTVLHLGASAPDGSVEIDLTIARPASARRTRGVSRAVNLEGGSSSERRRRRLR